MSVNLGNRPPTVQRYKQQWWPFGRKASSPAKTAPAAKPVKSLPSQTTASSGPATNTPMAPKPAAQPVPKSTGTRSGWLVREAIALIGMAGAALTVLAQLAWYVPMSAPFMDILGAWMTYNSNFWLTNYDQLGFYPHAHVQAAIALAVFLALIGLGARVAATLSGKPPERNWSLFQGMTWPSLVIMGILGVIFLIGHDPDSSSTSYDGTGGKETVKYLFAIILAAGYGLGDFLGQRGFHTRLYRLALLLILLLGLNQWLLVSH